MKMTIKNKVFTGVLTIALGFFSVNVQGAHEKPLGIFSSLPDAEMLEQFSAFTKLFENDNGQFTINKIFNDLSKDFQLNRKQKQTLGWIVFAKNLILMTDDVVGLHTLESFQEWFNNEKTICGSSLTKALNYQDETTKNTAVIQLAQEGKKELIQFLVDQGADLEKQNKNGKTALDVARENGYHELAQWLEEKLKEKNAEKNSTPEASQLELRLQKEARKKAKNRRKKQKQRARQRAKKTAEKKGKAREEAQAREEQEKKMQVEQQQKRKNELLQRVIDISAQQSTSRAFYEWKEYAIRQELAEQKEKEMRAKEQQAFVEERKERVSRVARVIGLQNKEQERRISENAIELNLARKEERQERQERIALAIKLADEEQAQRTSVQQDLQGLNNNLYQAIDDQDSLMIEKIVDELKQKEYSLTHRVMRLHGGRDGGYNDTPLTYALRKGKINVAKLLIQKDPLLADAKNALGEFPMTILLSYILQSNEQLFGLISCLKSPLENSTNAQQIVCQALARSSAK